MARFDEIAEGLSMLLCTNREPEPLRITLRNEGVTDTTLLVRAIIDSCDRRGSPLTKVLVCEHLGADLVKQYSDKSSGYQGVLIAGDPDLQSEIEIYRFPASD